jgi:uncharacterized protein (DUF4213/DUF364 family)
MIDALLGSLEGDAPVRRVVVGLHHTAVCSRRCGLSSTLTGSGPGDLHSPRDAGGLHLKSARTLAEYIKSANPVEASIGLAAINSLLPLPAGVSRSLNAFELLAAHGAGRRVTIVGHFPFVDRLRQAVGELWVVEQRPRGDDHPADRGPELVSRADVVGITGTALVNHTLEALLGACRRDAFIVMLGPSTPMWSGLFDFGPGALAGADVVDEPVALQAIAQGASFRDVPGVARVALLAPPAGRGHC